MNNAPIRRIVIVGGGTAGWMTAAALARVIGTRHHDITLVESDEIGTVGVGEATIPAIKTFNELLGLDEDEFVRETNGTYKLGIEFVDWRIPGSKYFHPFGIFGADLNGIAFQHYWMRFRAMGGTSDLGRFNIETEAARVGRFGRTSLRETHLPQVNYAFQFDAALYAAHLRRYAEKLGAVRIEGKVVSVSQDAETGYITQVELADGQVIAGDLFVDCSGFRAVLIGETLKTEFEDWSRWLPVNRAAAVPCERTEDPVPFTRCTAREAGWQWRIPLQHRTGNGYVFCNDFIGEDAAAAKLLTRLDGTPQADPRILKFTTGHRRRYWVKNCVAIGLSSGFLEPLESTSIHLSQACILRLISSFPRNGIDPKVVALFNDQMDGLYSNIRDFIIAHYAVTDREDTDFWAYCKHMSLPDSLRERLDLFAAHGAVPVGPGELFRDLSWFAVLTGQGLMPRSYHPAADALSDEQVRLHLAQVRAAIQTRLDGLSTHQAFIDTHGSVTAPRLLSTQVPA